MSYPLKFGGDEFVSRMHIEFVGDDDGHDGGRGRQTVSHSRKLVSVESPMTLDESMKTRRKEAGRVAFCHPRTITTCRDEPRPIRTHNK